MAKKGHCYHHNRNHHHHYHRHNAYSTAATIFSPFLSSMRKTGSDTSDNNRRDSTTTNYNTKNNNQNDSIYKLQGGAAAALQGYDACIRRGHSHNDYHQVNPLSSALRYGLSSIEVDVFPRNNGLWVGHTILELNPSRTIDNLYIQPILQFLQRQQQQQIPKFTTRTNKTIHRNSHPFKRTFNRRNQSSLLSSSLLSSSSSSYSSHSIKEKNKYDNNGHDQDGGDKDFNNNWNDFYKYRPKQKQHLIHPNDHDTLNLLVDFKGDAKKSVALLQKALTPLRPYLSKIDKNGKFHQGKVTVLISGNRPKDTSLLVLPLTNNHNHDHEDNPTHSSSSTTTTKTTTTTTTATAATTATATAATNGERYLFLDGRIQDIHCNTDTKLIPLVSMPWRQMHLSRILGRREQHMRRLADMAYEQGKILRIWGAPNCEHLWNLMMRANIDLLSVDDHAKFAKYASTVGAASATVSTRADSSAVSGVSSASSVSSAFSKLGAMRSSSSSSSNSSSTSSN